MGFDLYDLRTPRDGTGTFDDSIPGEVYDGGIVSQDRGKGRERSIEKFVYGALVVHGFVAAMRTDPASSDFIPLRLTIHTQQELEVLLYVLNVCLTQKSSIPNGQMDGSILNGESKNIAEKFIMCMMETQSGRKAKEISERVGLKT